METTEFIEPVISVERTSLTLGTIATDALVRECRSELQRAASQALQLCEKIPDKEKPPTPNQSIEYAELSQLRQLGATIEACAEVLILTGDCQDDTEGSD